MRAKILCLMLVLLLFPGCVFKQTPTPLPFTTPASTAILTTPSVTDTPAPATAILATSTIEPTATTPPATAIQQAGVTPASGQQITLEEPADGATVSSPVTLRGRASTMPFEGTLLVRIYDAQDQLVAEQPIIAEGEYGGPATFTAQIPYGGMPGAGRIEMLDISPKDGTVLGKTVRYVTLRRVSGSGYIEMPDPLEKVTLPLRILARTGQPGQQVNVTVTWEDGTQFARLVDVLKGTDGQGLVITALDWVTEPRPPQPTTQAGAIHIYDLEGNSLAYQPVVILHPDDPDAYAVQLYWVVNGNVVPQSVTIRRTQGIGRATLETLLWGPVPGNPSAYTSAIPSPAQVLGYAQRDPSWGEHVRITGLRITDGVAYADFSAEILAEPGGATKMLLIREQITQTLLQFSTINQVVITVEGQQDMLEP